MTLFQDKYLFETLKDKAFDLEISKQRIPNYITDNLRFPLFKWQENAMQNFLLAEALNKKKISVQHRIICSIWLQVQVKRLY